MADITVGTIKIYSDTVVAVRQAGDAMSVGEPNYLSAGKCYTATSNELAKAVIKGMAITAAAADGYFLNWEGGAIDLGATLTVGAVVRLSATGLTHDAPVSGKYVSEFGIAETAAKLPMDLRITGVATP